MIDEEKENIVEPVLDKDFAIVIPSYRRMNRIATLEYIPRKFFNQTYVVIDDEDYKKVSSERGPIFHVHPGSMTIAQKRAYIIRTMAEAGFARILMLDDDLRFSVRINDQTTSLRQASLDDMELYIVKMQNELKIVRHSGWSARQGNNNLKAGMHEACRMMYVLGYDVQEIVRLEKAGHIQLGRIETREDMELTLQLLKLGIVNTINADIAADQVGGYAAKGGCSSERTVESSNADAEKLAELHPGFVRVVEKSYKGSIPRKEVVVAWKKAYKYGLEKL